MNKRLYIPIVRASEIVKVYLDEIAYIESELRKINYYTDESTYSVYAKLDDIASKLPESFYRCHKRCFINLEKVRKMSDNTIYFENGKSIIMGQNNFIKAKHAYKNFLVDGNCVK